uniref:Uncharacterized protein n=1 Tax=Macaca fascicularis TaxID=9541 RepID=Q9GKU9_MACFA|nr:hypothetical protein [Macaca fascicularis]
MQPGPGSVCPWVSFHLLEPSVPICQMTRMLACFEEGGAQLSGREHPGDTHISVSSAQKPPSELMFVGTSTPLAWISFIFTAEETEATWRLRNSPRVLLSSPCRAPSECVAQENMQSDMVQKHYR